MRAVVTQVVTKRLGALPVVAEFLHRLRVAETVDGLCPVRDLALATHGEVIGALVANRLTSPRPLVRVEDWARTWAVKEVLELDPELLNDDRLGRALDAIAPHLDEITGSIAARAICEFGIDTATLHWDVTSMSLTGAFDPEDQDPDYPKVAYGHPKDRRVDLKQIQAGLGVSADGAVPLLATAISGGTGEITQVVSAIARFQKTAAVKRFLMIGDSKLVSYDNLTALSGAQVEFIAPLAASATDTAVFAALDPQTAKRVEYVPLRVADRPTMDRPDYRVLEDTHTLTGKRKSDPPITVRRILVHSAGNALAQAKARDKRLAKAREDLDKLARLAGSRYYPTRDNISAKIGVTRRQAARHRLPAHPHHRRPRRETRPHLALRPGRARHAGQGRRLVRPDHQPGPRESRRRRGLPGLQGAAPGRTPLQRAQGPPGRGTGLPPRQQAHRRTAARAHARAAGLQPDRTTGTPRPGTRMQPGREDDRPVPDNRRERPTARMIFYHLGELDLATAPGSDPPHVLHITRGVQLHLLDLLEISLT